METYHTELSPQQRYQVKVVRHDGEVRASGNFATLGAAHDWIDERRRRSEAPLESLAARQRAVQA
jgi:hypothetical protein